MRNAEPPNEYKVLGDSVFCGKAVAIKKGFQLDSYTIIFGPTTNDEIFNAWTAMNFRPDTMIKVSVYSA